MTPLLSLVLACSSKGAGPPGGDEDTSSEPSDTSGENDTDTSDEANHGPAEWFGIEGEVKLTTDSSSSSLVVHFYADDTTLGPVCSFQVDEESLTTKELSPDETIRFWWRSEAFESDERGDCEDSERLPPNLQLGVGRLHASVLPYLTAEGMEAVSVADGVYGSYIGFNESEPTEDDPGTAFVLGYANQELSGSETELGPDPTPGNFQIHGIFLFPLVPEADTGIVRQAQ